MIKFEYTDVWGFEGAIRGARNPKESHKRSDSYYNEDGYYIIGPNDEKLLRTLAEAGPDHGKFLRQIMVSVDITAPMFWWKERDTYKVGTVANSESTMHKLSDTPITMSHFSYAGFPEYYEANDVNMTLDQADYAFYNLIEALEDVRIKYNETKDKRLWRMLIELLPMSWNQKRTWTANYRVLRNIYHARKNHKLTEWHDFCGWIESLPYSFLIIGEEK